MSETRISQLKPNGALHASPAAATAQKIHSEQQESLSSVRERPRNEKLKLAPFADVEIQPSQGQMWPLHSVAWFHPELRARLPNSGGLSIEGRRELATPGFLPLEVTPADQAHSSDEVCDPLLPDLKRPIPESGLDPFGWDARVILLSTQGSAPKQSAARSEERGKR